MILYSIGERLGDSDGTLTMLLNSTVPCVSPRQGTKYDKFGP